MVKIKQLGGFQPLSSCYSLLALWNLSQSTALFVHLLVDYFATRQIVECYYNAADYHAYKSK